MEVKDVYSLDTVELVKYTVLCCTTAAFQKKKFLETRIYRRDNPDFYKDLRRFLQFCIFQA